MNDIIKSLIREYYSKRRIITDMYIFKSRGQQIINVFPGLHAAKWKLFLHGTTDIPDIDRADKILDMERLEIAKQLYDLALRSLDYKRARDDWNRVYGKAYISENKHEEMVNYSMGAFFWLKILTPYEYDISEPQIDESGKLLGMRLKPKPKPEDVLAEVEKYVGKFEEEEK